MTWPTDEARTAAVEAAAKTIHESHFGEGKWAVESPVVKHQFRDGILPVVEAALQALPDPLASVRILVEDAEAAADLGLPAIIPARSIRAVMR